MSISIVIVSWNTRDLLRECLRSVLADPLGEQCEVWVVDNASTDGTAEMTRIEFPQVQLVENESNLGFAGGNNIALRQVKGSKILLLNPDTVLLNGALEPMVALMERDPNIGAVGPQLLNPDMTPQRSAFPNPTLWRESWHLFHLDRLIAVYDYADLSSDREEPFEVDVIQGACILLRKSAIDQVGHLDEDYFMYSEEVDLCRRLKRAGWRLVVEPGARVVHHGGMSTRQAASESFLQLYRAKVLYLRKQYGPVTAHAFKAMLAIAAVIRILLGSGPLRLGSRRTSNTYDLVANYRSLLHQLPTM